MRFVCRYCRCYFDLTEPDPEGAPIDRRRLPILEQVEQIQSEQCPTMMKHITHSLFGEIDGRVLDA